MIPGAFITKSLDGNPDALRGSWPEAFSVVEIDTRRMRPGGLFVALKGERTDGHEHLAAARKAGAAAALVTRFVDDPLPQLRVEDGERALQCLAVAWRNQWAGKLVGLTGSNGKTTTREMLGSIVCGVGPSLVTRGNFNNHLGVPLTLLRLRSEHQFAVIEMGASAVGEIALLADWAKPDVSIVTLAAAAHLDGFGSLDRVAKGKGEIFSALGAQGTAVINADDAYAPFWRGLAGERPRIEFGSGAQVQALDAQDTESGSRFLLQIGQEKNFVNLQARGAHNRANASAAAAAAAALGLNLDQIVAGLEAFTPVDGRLRPIDLGEGRRLYDDSYNANPGSLRAAIDVLATEKAPQLLCLGNMAELGSLAPKMHAEVGEYAANRGIAALWSAGDLAALAAQSFGEGARQFDSVEQLSQQLVISGTNFQSILIKGSRGARMDKAVAALVPGGVDA